MSHQFEAHQHSKAVRTMLVDYLDKDPARQIDPSPRTLAGRQPDALTERRGRSERSVEVQQYSSAAAQQQYTNKSLERNRERQANVFEFIHTQRERNAADSRLLAQRLKQISQKARNQPRVYSMLETIQREREKQAPELPLPVDHLAQFLKLLEPPEQQQQQQTE